MPGVVLITSGSRGIGRVTAMRLMADGWTVAFTYHQSKDAASAFEVESKRKAVAFQADIRDRDECRRVVDEVLAKLGTVDALVNGTGIRRDALLYNMTTEQWDDVIATNLYGPWAAIKAVLPAMLQQRRGAIVTVGYVAFLSVLLSGTDPVAHKK